MTTTEQADTTPSASGGIRPLRLAYWLVAPLPQWRQKKVKALVEALTA